ncbi:zinc finger protein 160 isoform X2 [Plutella xylostella]|uniref:zinc finger protein 160 isoform X2 n=1 Tax=Plutella xylostella TaxID=51655 RepID=UPI002032F65C|nr:zinc finger protein 160 isoform X2 [Plutella xylostella]
MIQACVFCLSQDRDLLMIDETLYFSVYPSFKEKNNEYINYLKAENLLKLCWECQSRVTNFKKFLDTAERSLNTLKMVMVLPSGELPNSESRLHITTAYCIDIEGSVPPLLPPIVEQNIDDADHSAVEPIQQQQKDNDVSMTAVKLELNLDELDDNDICNDDGDGRDSDTQASVPGGSFSINNLSKDDNINKDNDTTSNKHIEDDHSLPAVWVAPLPLIIPGIECNIKITTSSLLGLEGIKKIKPSNNDVSLSAAKPEDSDINNDTTSNNHTEDDPRPPAAPTSSLPPDATKTPSIKIVETGKSAKTKKPRPKPLKSLKFNVVWASSEQAMRWHREELRRAREASLSFVHECDACERLFAEEEELNRHVGEAHSEEAGKYTCDVCLYRFPDHTKLKQHMEAHYINYKCKTCSFESRILAEMQKHVSDTHPNTKCLKCRNEFASKAEEEFSINNLSKDDNINKDNDTTSNKHIEDDHSLPAVWVAPLPLIIPISQCKKVSNQTSLPGKESNKKIISNQSSLTCKDSIKKIKLSDNSVRKNDNINNDNDTTFNKHIEDDHRSPEVRDEPLPLIIPKSQYKRVSKQSRPPGIECNIKITTNSLLGQESIKKIKLSDNDNDVSVSAAKLEDSDINNETTSNNHTEDDPRPPATSTSSLPPDSTKTPCIKIEDSGKSAKKIIPRPKPLKSLKFDVVWVTTEQAMRWHREELRRAREASLSFVHECDACERLFADEEELNTHVGEAHSEKAGQYTCDMCLYRFPEQAKLEQHMEGHYVCYKCKNCSFECRELREMEEHVKNPHNIIQKPVCIRCKNEFVSKEELKEHLTTCKTYKCAECDKTFVVRGSYQKHVREHKQDPGGIYCEICKVHYKASYYKEHLITSLKHVSEDDFKYKCNECDKKFPTSTRLRLHMFGNHKRPGPHPCKLCPKSYFDKMKLARHIANVHKIGPVIERKKDKICETCGKGFSSSTLLTNHIRIHTGERPWRCEECPAAFAQNGTFYMHMKQVHGKTIDRHGREKLTEKVCCDACGAAFNTRAGLAQHHNLLHAEKTDYQCETCEKYCRTAQGLQKHTRTHAPPAPLPCHTCGKTFKTRGAHTQHIQKKHGIAVVERPFKCRSCDAAYSVQTNLYTHYKVKHLGLKSSDKVKIMNLFNLDKEVMVVARK